MADYPAAYFKWVSMAAAVAGGGGGCDFFDDVRVQVRAADGCTRSGQAPRIYVHARVWLRPPLILPSRHPVTTITTAITHKDSNR